MGLQNLKIILIALVSPLFLWIFVAKFFLGQSVLLTGEHVPVRIYFLLAYITSLIIIIKAFKNKLYRLSIMSAGVLLILTQLVVLYLFSFKGFVDIGETESFDFFEKVERGKLAKINHIPLSISRIENNEALILIGNREYKLKKNKSIWWNGYKIKLIDIYDAPFFKLMDAKNNILEEGFVKYRPSKEDPYFFQFRIIPHQLFLYPSEENSEDIYMRVLRGKLTIFNGVIKVNDPILIDGFNVIYEKGLHWARIKIERGFLFIPLYLGVGFIIFSIAGFRK